MENEFLGATASSQLSIEAKSILKSVQTEDAKLSQSSNLTRSDFHYFRARFNYYRLSLMRLPGNEREVLEPVLGRFLDKITQNEVAAHTENPVLEKPRPFLEAVGSQALKVVPEKSAEPVLEPIPTQIEKSAPLRADLSKKLISQLKMIKMALQAEPTKEGQKTLSEGIDRMIDHLQE